MCISERLAMIENNFSEIVFLLKLMINHYTEMGLTCVDIMQYKALLMSAVQVRLGLLKVNCWEWEWSRTFCWFDS